MSAHRAPDPQGVVQFLTVAMLAAALVFGGTSLGLQVAVDRAKAHGGLRTITLPR